MKGRSLKLREAHKTNGIASVCSILWSGDGHRLITRRRVRSVHLIHDQSQPSKAATSLRYHKDGVTALALSPNSTSLASGSIDHSVKLYTFPDGEFQSNVTRFTLPIRCLAFNKSGSLLAAAGDDDGIKLIATVDSSISRVLKGHKGSVTCLAFDPKNQYLASVDGFGTVIFWELSSGRQIHTLRGVAPNCEADDSLLNLLSWSPDGETLAVPGLRNEVVMYDRDTAEKLFTLKGDHEKTVCFLSWSPNGKYMATSGLDKQVLIWDIDQRQDIDRQKFDDRICCLAWKPNGNSLAVIDTMGKFSLWESPVPTCMKSPTDGTPSLNENGFILFDDDEDDHDAHKSDSLDDDIEDGHGESFLSSRKRFRKQSHLDENTDDNSDGEEGLLRQIESRKRSSTKRKENVGIGTEHCVTSRNSSSSKMQDAFQSGATPVQAGKRRFLAYNMLGSITTIENETYSHIEVDFHDTGRGPRVPSMTDHFGFTMASLNENGSIFANPCKGEKNMSTLMYRPFGSWASNSEWSMRFEAEEVKAVALGTGWVAAVTNLNFLRIFTEGGLQRHIISLNGPVVTAAGYKDEVAVVTHVSDCLPSGDQVLEVKVFNISERTQTITSRLPLTPNACLSWFGFSEEGQLSAYDSKGVLRVFGNLYGGTWLPIFSASKAKKSEDENYWAQKKIEEVAASGLDTTILEDETFNMEASIDRCILRLIASCCNADKLVRAIELARLLTLKKSLMGAIKLATTLKLPLLAERFNGILEERLSNECREANITNTQLLKSSPASEIKRTAEPSTTLPLASSSHSHFSKHGKLEQSTISGVIEPCKNMKGGVSKVGAQTAADPFAKAPSNQEKAEINAKKDSKHRNAASENSKEQVNHKFQKVTTEGVSDIGSNEKQCIRPTNPFAKSSNNQDKSSLFDSIKKMRKADIEKNEKVSSKKAKA
ncbi:uncharacterized protein A4U43_C05F9120 [Asparagus officinalis]|uniref:Uncharacterized protein n=1 Tax=Asparagus officinalis TaxID=4686 RepID=A0A5P1ESZ8_ASPOF|nr:uncharacterized protein A4U43_C05F9120 [Asparagus officinalis]